MMACLLVLAFSLLVSLIVFARAYKTRLSSANGFGFRSRRVCVICV
jgi:hypothetical protein